MIEQLTNLLTSGNVPVLLKDDWSYSAVRAILPGDKVLRTKFDSASVEAAIKSKDFMHGKMSYLDELSDDGRVLEIVCYPVVAAKETHTISIDGREVEISEEQYQKLLG